jgi:HAMP domain-containing protein
MSFFLIAILVLIAVQSFYLIVQLSNMTERFSEKGTQIIKDMAEKDILKTAIFSADQAKSYLEANPYLKKEDFLNDPQFKAIATQKVGTTGYTVLYEKTDDGRLILRVHRNPKICAPIIPELSMLKERLGVNFPEFWRIQVKATPSKPSVGYYKWQEDDKSFRDKYMACVNIKGTNFYIASTTYIDEFLQPMQHLKNQAENIAKAERNKNAIIVFVISTIVAAIAFTFGGKLSSNIMYLSDITDRISLGDLDAIIEKRSKDELGVLTDSISRLRNSVKFSMKRLRK